MEAESQKPDSAPVLEGFPLIREKQCSKCKVLLSEKKAKYCGDGSDKDNSHSWVVIE